MAKPRDFYHPSQPREIFIIRLWRAPQVEDWVVELQTVRTRETRYLSKLDEIAACLREQLERRTENPAVDPAEPENEKGSEFRDES